MEGRRKRNYLEIAMRILEVARGGTRKTRIMYDSSLGYEQLERYLSKLIDAGLLYQDPLTKKYQTTVNGMRYLRAYIKFREKDERLLRLPIPNIIESAGALSTYADSKEVLSDLLRAREENFR